MDISVLAQQTPTSGARTKTTNVNGWFTIMVPCYIFISSISSSMMAPGLGRISTNFRIENQIVSQLMLSVFILAFAIGPLFFGPPSEVYGRVPVLPCANMIFLIFNIVCAFRFLAGIGGSAPLTVRTYRSKTKSVGILGDLFSPEQRGKSMAIYTLAPLLGPALDP
ncbi:MFS general substrate transporter [Aspergillus niger CBS 101883]|uniref:MFS general substrate transporter n=1 Tax=Aspergillus lacticoffeatus (strain CBS 101883) TaxID=1450533 RepID=UPI000D7F1863|nr:MFS general substrate transporter [Aspergillus niger CBS 101883]PYH62129.1 MFS general substrate transporter [Aspergillus niger CBS 101883]